MNGIYCANPALNNTIVDALEIHGLHPDPAAVNRRPQPAKTLGEQMQRIDLAGQVLALIRRSVPVGEQDRRLIERLVGSACQRVEEAERPASGLKYAGASDAAVIAYAAAGGAMIGTFESFRRTFVSSVELTEPAVDRQDVPPPPLTTNPRRRPQGPKLPGSSSPLKTNPIRTIRSSRWRASGKAVRS